MSRYDDDGDFEENFPNEADLWQANAERALKGKRGRKVLAELREALLALPEKRLISSALCTVNPERRAAQYPDRVYDGRTVTNWTRLELEGVVEDQGQGVCAIGAYLWYRKVKAGADPVEAFDDLPTILGDDGGLEATAQLAKRDAGVVFSLAWNIAYRNDENFGRKTPEARHAAFIEWIDRELDPSAVTG